MSDVFVQTTLADYPGDRTLATVRVHGAHEYGIQMIHPTRHQAKAWVLAVMREEVSDVG